MPTSLRLSLFYAAIFGLVGVFLPFWPVWLAGRGLGSFEIGAATAAGMMARALTSPVIGSLADRADDRRIVMIAASVMALASAGLLYVAVGFWPILLGCVLLAISHGALGPLIENLAMLLATARGINYGRVRSLGSVAFIAMAVAAGWILAGRSSETVLLIIAIWLVLTVLAAFALPAAPPVPQGQPRGEAMPLLRQPTMRWLMLAVTLIQTSHMVYYSFGTLEWRRVGISDGIIGALWGMGVTGEVLFFLFAQRVLRWVSPVALIVISGAGGAVRWVLMAFVTQWPLLAAVQVLHSLSFACCHLGMMMILSRAVPVTHSATAQGLVTSLAYGLGMGAMSVFSGWLYAEFGPRAYLFMAVAAALGIGAVAMLARRWNGGVLDLKA